MRSVRLKPLVEAVAPVHSGIGQMNVAFSRCPTVSYPGFLPRHDAVSSPRHSQGRGKLVAVRPKTTVQQHIAATCPTHSRTDLRVRDLESVIDEPKERDGTNLGFTPTETLIASLIGCTNVIGHKIAHKHGIEFDEMAIEAEATFDRRGVMLAEEGSVPFPRIVLTINLRTGASEAEMEKVKTELPKFCPVSKLIREAGTVIEEVWNVTRA